MRNNVLNLLLFSGLAVGFYFLWTYAEKNWLPKPPEVDKNAKKADPPLSSAALAEAKRVALASVAGLAVNAAEDAKREAVELANRQAAEKAREERKSAAAAAASYASVLVDPVRPPPPQPTLIALGDSTFYNQVLLSTRGGGVQQIVLPEFAMADRLGREVKGERLFLVPGIPQPRPYFLADPLPIPKLQPGKVPLETALAEPAYNTFHYPNPDDKTPDPLLGEMLWTVVAEERPEGGEHKVALEAELGDPYFVKFRKTYTLKPQDYHVGLKVEIERLPQGVKGKGQLRYQISGPRGIPIEGEWYTWTHRVSLIGWLDLKGAPRRQFETASEVAAKRGGEVVPKGENTFKYMAVANQFFASALAIDNTAEGEARNPWAYVRATTELPFDKLQNPKMPYFDDVTVRAASDVLDLAPGETVAHSYLIYNGPSKVKLLGLMEGDRAVNPELVDRYAYQLGLKTITDFHSPTWLGSFASAIYWSDIVITFTNVMHWLLATIHSVVPDWALCIVVLTVIVRLVLLIPSKKQTKMNMRMIEVQKQLAPQLEELKKKHGDNFNEYNRAKMQLMMANGVNPFAAMGGCLLLFAQMPIMMGLYFCLQESVFFRLEPFLWIQNLAAPDMTWWWGERIPYISSPDNIGSFIYLGPYLNILPILAAVLMIGQQLLMLPPPTDDQSRQQRTMMKMMMVMMPILFYKFAAGLALYFIIGSVWALIERKLIPRADLGKLKTTANGNGGGGSGGGAVALPPATPTPPKPKGMLGRMLEQAKERMEELQKQADEQSKRQIRNEKGDDSSGSGPKGPRRDDRRDNDKKKRRK